MTHPSNYSILNLLFYIRNIFNWDINQYFFVLDLELLEGMFFFPSGHIVLFSLSEKVSWRSYQALNISFQLLTLELFF